MADADLNELRALRRRSRAVIARAEAALSELRDLNVLMDGALDRMVKRSEGKNEDTASRDNSGALQRRIARVILAEGGAVDGVWTAFEQIAAALPDDSLKALRRSLESGTERLWEAKADAYRLLDNGMKLSALA